LGAFRHYHRSAELHSAVSRIVQPSFFDRPTGASPVSVKMMEPSSDSRLALRETSERASSAVNGPRRGRMSPVVGPEVLTNRRAAALSEHCCLVNTAHTNPIRVEPFGGRTSNPLVKAPIARKGNSDGVKVAARREGLSEQRREGDWRRPEGQRPGGIKPNGEAERSARDRRIRP
jgi:hypothetical protein